MSRLSLPILPAVLLLAACGSPNDGTSQSESATVPADEGAMTAPDMSSDTDNNNAGTMTGPAADGSMSGSIPSGPDGTTDPQSGSRSEEHTSELQSLMRISYAVFCLKKKNTQINNIANSYDTMRQTIKN